MTQSKRIKGVLAPFVTPFNADLSPDPERFIAHCRWLLSQHCGLAAFGTNSEANSLSINERMGDARLRFYLYHIPPVAVVGISPALVERLLKAYPTAIAGMKDSSGNWNNTKTMLDAFAKSGFDVFAGSESFLLANMRNGGAGCISATANVNPAAIDKLYREWRDGNADEQQAALNVVRDAFGKKYTMIPALKQAVAHFGG